MSNQYHILRDKYDDLVKNLVPKLTIESVDEAIKAVNLLVRLQRPADWRYINEPRIILGMTADQERVVYGEAGMFAFYHALPYKELYQKVLSTGDKPLLESLVSLKPN